MDICLKSDECIDDLQYKNLSIIQKKHGFRYGTDAVLLADFAGKNSYQSVLDLCTGTAIVPILLSGYTDTKKIFGLEIQEEIADMAKRSVLMNSLENRIRIDCGDLKNAEDIYGMRVFDAIVCNPPYIKHGAGLVNNQDTKIISRHEVLCSLEDVVKISSKLLKDRGHFFMVHRPNRLVDIIYTMRSFQIEPKRMQFVHPSYGKTANLVLIEGILYGGAELKMEVPIYIFNADGKYTDEMKKIYRRL
ncbi:MAG: tRNA1(Val) (adenine(37)-N6)-methyltransferase [Clostridia bacterium]|nr:tRNA1(Val) (adenine(37)-N6)-methyltransferase [Clostridia bacterium]